MQLQRKIKRGDAFIYTGLAAATVAVMAVFVSQQSVIIYNEVALTEENVGQMNVDLLRGREAILEYYRNNSQK